MNWTSLLLFAAVVLLLLVLRRAGQISAKTAREYIRNGALVIDVRTQVEYASGHLPRTIHIPLDQIESGLPRRVPDKTTVLLLHCQSGIRSRVAKNKAKALGYTQAFNLGSLSRAGQILTGK